MAKWPGKVVVKGVQSVADSVRLADAGVDAIVLSNHGAFNQWVKFRESDRCGYLVVETPNASAPSGG